LHKKVMKNPEIQDQDVYLHISNSKTCLTEWQQHICYNIIASAERPYFPNNHQPSKEQYGHRVSSSFHQPMC
jgi:hypothetical protein